MALARDRIGDGFQQSLASGEQRQSATFRRQMFGDGGAQTYTGPVTRATRPANFKSISVLQNFVGAVIVRCQRKMVNCRPVVY